MSRWSVVRGVSTLMNYTFRSDICMPQFETEIGMMWWHSTLVVNGAKAAVEIHNMSLGADEVEYDLVETDYQSSMLALAVCMSCVTSHINVSCWCLLDLELVVMSSSKLSKADEAGCSWQSFSVHCFVGISMVTTWKWNWMEQENKRPIYFTIYFSK